MLRFPTLVLLTALILLSSGCQSVPKMPTYAYIPPEAHADKFCAVRCYSAKRYCEQICKMKNSRCFMREEQFARFQYNFYQLEMMREGKEIKSFKDFNHSGCLGSCQCTSSFNTCYVACGGQVTKLR